MKRPWVQIAIDTLEIRKGKQLAKMALEAGADWIEAGTPLITFESVRAIGELVKVCGATPVIADFKAQDGVAKYFQEAGRQGAKAAVVLGVVADGSIKAAVRGAKEAGIHVIADMFSVKHGELAERAKHVERLGVDYIMLHLGFDEAQDEPHKHCLGGLEELLQAVSVPVGVGTFHQDEAVTAVKMGASFIIQGEPLLSADDAPLQLARFIEAVKQAI